MSSSSSERKKIYLKDYQAPEYWIKDVHLDVDLFEDHAEVTSVYSIERNCDVANTSTPLRLDGEELEFVSAKIDGNEVSAKTSKDGLMIADVPEKFSLETVVRLKPQDNKSMEGLYKSGTIFCTQCEAEGFRRITYFVDRPDNMSLFKTTIRADKAKYPYLLSNGNKIDGGDLDGGRHFATWEDPFKKPAYLFALVAGDFDVAEDTFTTQSGRKVDLQVFVDKGRKDRTPHTLSSLKRSMKWDEERYGLEYDLDIFMIVAVDDFNMGAMENKGLNIFNSRAALANPMTASDYDYENVDAIIAHEYFHNWTGNRVTCRDWFQLSLKEGLTVYRDQEYTSDNYSRPVKRIDDVNGLRISQFEEDAGPNAHPVRPAYCYSVDNFYTTTIYEKGAEVIRMIEEIVGRDGFRKGMDKYFELYDGQAVTTEDFVHAIEVANNVDLTQFKRWYDQAGTPVVKVSSNYDKNNKQLNLKLEQSCPATPEQATKAAFHIPIRVGLVDESGNDIDEKVLQLTEMSQDFIFENVNENPTLSLLRNFSAPIKLEVEQSDAELSHLMKYDNNSFNRWESGQKLALRHLVSEVESYQPGKAVALNEDLASAYQVALSDADKDPLFSSRLLSLPNAFYLNQFLDVIDPVAVYEVRKSFRSELAKANRERLMELYNLLHDKGPYFIKPEDIAKRYLKTSCLISLCSTGDPEAINLAKEQYFSANNMTDKMSALQAILDHKGSPRDEMMAAFYQDWKDDRLVLNKYFSLECISVRDDILDKLKTVMTDQKFDKFNPNNISSSVGSFAHRNPVGFHQTSGAGYKFVADQVIEIDKRNPQVAAGIVSAFDMWKHYDTERQSLMKSELERIVAVKDLSKNTFELASNALK